MIKEFRDFINKGGVFEAAVGLIMALAFLPVVTSLVDDILMPIIGRIFGQPDFSALEWKIGGEECTTDAEGIEVCTEAAIRYGAWINTIVAFVLIALVVFVLVKMYNSRVTATEEDEGPTDNELLTEIRDSLKK